MSADRDAVDRGKLGYDQNLYMLAFDHRASFQKGLFGIDGMPSAEEKARIGQSKLIIFEGLRRAVEDGAPKEWAGVLVDEHFGSVVARTAKREAFTLAMPAEESGQDEFDFEFGDDFGAHIEAFDPEFTKVLVRYNPEGDEAMNRRQLARLKTLSDWLHDHDRKFLFELLVPAEPEQLERVGGDKDRYDLEIRPDLVVRVIAESQAADVEPDIWKIEGLDRREDCQRVVVQARAEGRDRVSCVVLGRGANDERVVHWLRQGAGVPGFIGFAVGRTIWWDPLKSWVAGDADSESAAQSISQNYRRMVEAYESAVSDAHAEVPDQK
jgi:myo-inositol catabolism protein IolC